jgi:hypothetical protein
MILFIVNISLSEEINEDTIDTILEYSTKENRMRVLIELFDFLQPKWNFDKNYASQVLGFLTGMMNSNKEAVEYYNKKKYLMVNERMTKVIDYIVNKNTIELSKYIVENKLSLEQYLWYAYFGCGLSSVLDDIINIYNLENGEELDNLLFLRYYYERHDEVRERVDKRDEIAYIAVRSMTYLEMKNKIQERLIETMKKGWKK